MNLKSTLQSWLGALLFLAGVLIGLFLSASATWGEYEASVYTPFISDTQMSLQCPLMLAYSESGVVKADITNFTTDNILPIVTLEVSHAGEPRIIEQTITLASGKSKPLAWNVNSADVIFGKLILVNVLQASYR